MFHHNTGAIAQPCREASFLPCSVEFLEKESKEKEERLNKFKAVAVKARKELDNSKKEVCICLFYTFVLGAL